MKISITSEQTAVLSEHRDAIARLVSQHDTTQASLSKMREELPLYTARIAELECATDHADEKAVADLLTKQGQSRLIQTKIPLAQSTLQAIPVQLFEAICRAQNAIRDAVKPALESLRLEVGKSLRPHFGPGDGLAEVVEDVPTIRSFRETFKRPLSGGPDNALKYAPNALAMLDELISGEKDWAFTPEK